MKTSKPGKTIYVEMGIWYNETDRQIHLTAKGVEGFHSTVSNDPESKRRHPNLFRKLAKMLKDADAPHPEVAERA